MSLVFCPPDKMSITALREQLLWLHLLLLVLCASGVESAGPALLVQGLQHSTWEPLLSMLPFT